MAISPRFCTPRGISWGLRNAAQKKAITPSAQITAISIGLVKLNEPIVNSGRKSKLCSPGAGYPHPLKMWHPPPARAATSPVTGHPFVLARGGDPPEPPDHGGKPFPPYPPGRGPACRSDE